MPRTRVTAVLGRAPSGVSIRPFLCEDERGRILYVKPFGSLPDSLISEWLAARLARELGLPIPDFDLVDLPVELCRAAGHSDLKPGPAFASVSLGPGAADVQPRDQGRIRPGILAETLVFDAWIQNADRILGPLGGNPNAMMVSPGSRFFLIDHDNGFDPEWNQGGLPQLHLARQQAAHWLNSSHRAEWLARARKAFDKFDVFWQELPPDWLQGVQERRPTFRSQVLDILRLPFDAPDEFWTIFHPNSP
ncbi:MAG: HipA family kinase [Verrucomicrobiota bacterium]